MTKDMCMLFFFSFFLNYLYFLKSEPAPKMNSRKVRLPSSLRPVHPILGTLFLDLQLKFMGGARAVLDL